MGPKEGDKVTDMRLRQRKAGRQRRRLAQLAGRAARREEALLLAHQDGSGFADAEYKTLIGDCGLQPMTDADWLAIRSAWSFPQHQKTR